MPPMPGGTHGDVTDLPPMPMGNAPRLPQPHGPVKVHTGLSDDLARLYNEHKHDVNRQNQLLLIQIVRELQTLNNRNALSSE
jgi:hypothetical protein